MKWFPHSFFLTIYWFGVPTYFSLTIYWFQGPTYFLSYHLLVLRSHIFSLTIYWFWGPTCVQMCHSHMSAVYVHSHTACQELPHRPCIHCPKYKLHTVWKQFHYFKKKIFHMYYIWFFHLLILWFKLQDNDIAICFMINDDGIEPDKLGLLSILTYSNPV